jgi:hypothetical protein
MSFAARARTSSPIVTAMNVRIFMRVAALGGTPMFGRLLGNARRRPPLRGGARCG